MNATVMPIPVEGSEAPTVAQTVEVFFERVDIAEGTARKYRHTLGRLVERHGKQRLPAVGADELTELLEELAVNRTEFIGGLLV